MTKKSKNNIQSAGSGKPSPEDNPSTPARNRSSAHKRYIKGRNLGVSRGIRRKHLDQRLRALQQRIRIVESQLQRLENRFYRVCIFGSARIKPDNEIYGQVTRLADLLAERGIDILTGGGPGLMEAANLGAQLGRDKTHNKIRSYGLPIELAWEPKPNQHLDVKRHHNKFSSRLDDFMRLSHAVICTPGGIGTLLELLFSWQLIQVKHIPERPVVLLDSSYWNGFIDWMRAVPLKRKLVSPENFDPISIVDTPEEAVKKIIPHHEQFLKSRGKLDKLSREY